MKPFLGVDKTTNKKNEELSGVELVAKLPSPALSDSYNAQLDTASNSVIKLLHSPLSILSEVSGGIALIIISVVIDLWAEDGIPLMENLRKSPWLIAVVAGLLIICAISAIASKKRYENKMKSDETELQFSNLDSLALSIRTDLGIPTDADEIELLSFNYKCTDGEYILQKSKLEPLRANNFSYYIYRDGENINLADFEGVFVIPKGAIRSFRMIDEKVVIPSWLKEGEPKDEEYKHYKIKESSDGDYYFKGYACLETELGGEVWGIYIPAYDIPLFTKVTGIQIADGKF